MLPAGITVSGWTGTAHPLSRHDSNALLAETPNGPTPRVVRDRLWHIPCMAFLLTCCFAYVTAPMRSRIVFGPNVLSRVRAVVVRRLGAVVDDVELHALRLR
jgi:hypothetical protein